MGRAGLQAGTRHPQPSDSAACCPGLLGAQAVCESHPVGIRAPEPQRVDTGLAWWVRLPAPDPLSCRRPGPPASWLQISQPPRAEPADIQMGLHPGARFRAGAH